MASTPVGDPRTLTLPLLAEQVTVARRRIAGDLVRVATSTRDHEHEVTEELTHERVVVDRVAIGRVVDAMPAVREEGDVTIVPVVEEVVVVERRLVLKEEVRMRRVRVTEPHRETVLLRQQTASVQRIPSES